MAPASTTTPSPAPSTRPASPVTRSDPSACQVPASGPGSSATAAGCSPAARAGSSAFPRRPGRQRGGHQAGQQGRQHRARHQRQGQLLQRGGQVGDRAAVPAHRGRQRDAEARPGRPARASTARMPPGAPGGYRAAPCWAAPCWAAPCWAARAGLPAAGLQPADRLQRRGPLRPVPDRRLQGQLVLGGSDRHRHLPFAAAPFVATLTELEHVIVSRGQRLPGRGRETAIATLSTARDACPQRGEAGLRGMGKHGVPSRTTARRAR